MKRVLLVAVWLCFAAVAAPAQLGKKGTIAAGSPEDRAMLAIENEKDPQKRIELLEKFVQEFTGEARLVGYQRLQVRYLQLGDLDKSLLSGLQALRLDAANFETLTNLTRAFVSKKDLPQAFNYGFLAAGLVQRLKKMDPPEGTNPDVWQGHKASLLEQARPDLQYLEYTLYQLALEQSDPATQGAWFERYLEVFSDSNYFAAAYQACLGAYQRGSSADKVLEVGEIALELQPENPVVPLLVADVLSEMGQHLDRADALAAKVPELADKAVPPESQTEEQFAQQKNTWKGVALSVQGQVLLHWGKTPEAVAKFAAADPLLAAEPLARARNLYRLGFAYAKLGRLDPAQRYLMQAVAIESPYKPLAEDLLNKVNQARAKRPQ